MCAAHDGRFARTKIESDGALARHSLQIPAISLHNAIGTPADLDRAAEKHAELRNPEAELVKIGCRIAITRQAPCKPWFSSEAP
jgi:hypothetical protein